MDAADRQHPDECNYIACSEVEILGLTTNYIYGSWLARSVTRLREAPDVEIYDHRFNADSPDS